MSNIVRLKTPQNDVIEAVEFILDMAKKGEMLNFVFAARCPDGNVATSWCNADVGTKMELVGHLQADIMMAVVEANLS